MSRLKCKRSQIWIETVIYTLIGITIIGILLAVITPRIGVMKDKMIVEQTIDSMNQIDAKIEEALSSPGNSRQVSLVVKKGEYSIDPVNDSIYFRLKDTGYMMSQIGSEIKNGHIYVLTTDNKGKYNIVLTLKYSGEIQFDDKDTEKILTPAPSAYDLLIENKGNNKVNIKLV